MVARKQRRDEHSPQGHVLSDVYLQLPLLLGTPQSIQVDNQG